jgi:hypothetical protein
LTLLRRVQRHAVSINGAAPIGGVSPLSPEQAAVLAALNIKKPTVQTQLNLLRIRHRYSL